MDAKMSTIIDLDPFLDNITSWPDNGTSFTTSPVSHTGTDLSSGHDDVISTVEKIIEALLLSVFCVLAFSGNVLLWCVVVRNKALRTTSNALVLCLSSADILVSVVNMPITIFTILNGDRFFGNGLCVILGFANMTFFIASVMSLAAISLNRYVLIVHPKKFKNIYTIRNTGFIILAVWLLSTTLATPPLIGWARYDYLPGQSFCFCDWEDSITYTFFMVIVCFGGPCSVMSFCYYNILQEVRRSRKRLAGGPGSEASNRNSVHNAGNTISNNNSSTRQENRVPAKNGNHNEGFIGGDNDTLEEIKKSKLMSLHEAVIRQLSRKRIRVDPGVSDPSESAPGAGRPVSLPCRITTATNESCSPIRNSSSLRAGGRYQPQASKLPKIRLEEFHRSESLDSRRGSCASLAREDSLEEPAKSGRSSPKIQQKILRKLPGSMLAVPSLKPPVGLRKRGNKTASEMRRKQEELKLTKSFLVVILVFIICWFPFCITMFWSVFSPYPVFRPADMASLLLGFFNSCCNPFIYGVMNTRFRAGFKYILCCHWTPWYRSKSGTLMPDRGFGSVTGTALAYNDDVGCTA